MVDKIHYRWDFIGLSTDNKPTPADSPKVVNGSTFYESDTSKLFVFYKDTWYERKPLGGGGGSSYTAGDGIDITNSVISATNTGKARELTTDDYNYPVDNPTGVALWLLEPGIYTNAQGVMVYSSSNSSSDTMRTFIVGNQTASGREIVELTYSSSNNQFVTFRHLNDAGTQTSILSLRNPIDNLTSTSTSVALSANQGRVLKSQIGDLTALDTTAQTDLVSAINELAGQSGGGGIKELTSADFNYDPNNTGTNTAIGLWLLDPGIYEITDSTIPVYPSQNATVSAPILFIIGDSHGTGNSASRSLIAETYTAQSGDLKLIKGIVRTNGGTSAWTDVSPPTVVQATGASTTNVMSQYATTTMVFANPSNLVNGGIKIGASASVATSLVRPTAIGSWASATGSYSIALGANATATQKGQFDVSTGDATTGGFNSSNYRLLTGLYDGQSDHDAATVGQINATIDAINTALSTSIPHIGA